MAAPLMQGFTMDDYVLADQLGYTREQFEGMGQSGMRDMLTKKTPQKSYVTPTSVMPKIQNQQMSYNTPDGTQPNLFPEDQMSYNTADGSKPGTFDLASNYVPEPVNLVEDPAISTASTPTINVPAITAGEQSLIDQRNASTALDTQLLKDAQGFDWMGATNVGLQGLNTAMQVGMYGDQKDYMQNVNAGLEQNMRNAQATHDNRVTQQKNLGSTFSRNA